MTVTAPQQPVHMPALLIDQFVPHSQFGSARHRIAEAAPADVYAAARGHGPGHVPWPLADAVPWLRSFHHGHRISPQWTILAERDGDEIVFGTLLRCHQPSASPWPELEPRDFREFEEAGYGKLAAGISVRPYGRRRSLLSHDVRLVLTDPACWASFHRCWPLVAPLLGRDQNATLKAVEATATTLTTPLH